VRAGSGNRLDGLVIKKDSPSSGLFRVKVYSEQGMAPRNGTGMFTREVMKHFPLLPLEEDDCWPGACEISAVARPRTLLLKTRFLGMFFPCGWFAVFGGLRYN
jgi:hypothetical protein